MSLRYRILPTLISVREDDLDGLDRWVMYFPRPDVAKSAMIYVNDRDFREGNNAVMPMNWTCV